MSGPHALILAGSGMLTDVAERLTRDGWTVVQPSRRYTPVPVSPDGDPRGHAVWIRAQWDEPETLGQHVADTMGATPIDLVVTWLREDDRGPVLDAIAPLVGARAPVVDVRSAAESGLVPGLPEPASPLGDRPTQRVMFGELSALAPGRPLMHREIVAAALTAVRRALAGAGPSTQHVGERTPRPRVPRPRLQGAAPAAGVPGPRAHSA